MQIMLNQNEMKFPQQECHDDLFKQYVDKCQRGAIVGVSGFPGRTDAGEFTIVAEDFSLLAQTDKNLPMMNWNHKKTLKDSEKRFKYRHLDFIVNNELKQFFH